MAEQSPLGVLLFYSLLMVLCPISTFFITRNLLVIFTPYTDTLSSSIGGAICAVLVTHCVVAAFVYKAYNEKDDGPTEKVPQKID